MQTIFNMLPNCNVELIIVVCNFPFNLVYFHIKTPTKAMHRDILCYLERGSVLISFVVYYNLQIIEYSYFMVEFNWKCVSRCYETNRSFQLKHDLAGLLLLETISLSINPDCQKRTKKCWLPNHLLLCPHCSTRYPMNRTPGDSLTTALPTIFTFIWVHQSLAPTPSILPSISPPTSAPWSENKTMGHLEKTNPLSETLWAHLL